MLLSFIKDSIEEVGLGLMCVKTSVDAKAADIKYKAISADTERLQKKAKKREEEKEKRVDDLEKDLKDLFEKEFGVKVIEESKEKVRCSDKWAEQLDFLTSFIQKVRDANEKDEVEKIKAKDVHEWLDLISDPDAAANVIMFGEKYNTDVMIRMIDDINQILYSYYPGYEDLYLDKEKELTEENTKAIMEQREKGGSAKIPRVLMTKLPESAKMPAPKKAEADPEEVGNSEKMVTLKMPKPGEFGIFGGSGPFKAESE